MFDPPHGGPSWAALNQLGPSIRQVKPVCYPDLSRCHPTRRWNPRTGGFDLQVGSTLPTAAFGDTGRASNRPHESDFRSRLTVVKSESPRRFIYVKLNRNFMVCPRRVRHEGCSRIHLVCTWVRSSSGVPPESRHPSCQSFWPTIDDSRRLSCPDGSPHGTPRLADPATANPGSPGLDAVPASPSNSRARNIRHIQIGLGDETS